MRLEEIHTLAIPKFKYTFMISLKNILENMGAKSMFDDTKANFSGMTQADNIVVDDVI